MICDVSALSILSIYSNIPMIYDVSALSIISIYSNIPIIYDLSALSILSIYRYSSIPMIYDVSALSFSALSSTTMPPPSRSQMATLSFLVAGSVWIEKHHRPILVNPGLHWSLKPWTMNRYRLG